MNDPEPVATGFQFLEGPVWIPAQFPGSHTQSWGESVLFNDIPAGKTFKWSDKGCELVRSANGNANGMTFGTDGGLIVCEHGGRRVIRLDGGMDVTVVASHYQGRRLNSPNDVISKSDGSVWFTDPPYGVDDADRELDFQGVYCVRADGEMRLLADDLEKPNGLAFSLDEQTLLVADTERGEIIALKLGDDLRPVGRSVFCRVRRPDGLRLDEAGNVWIATLDGIEVFDPSGRPRERISLPERPANLTFGGPDGRTLYICARTSLYTMRCETAGANTAGGPRWA